MKTTEKKIWFIIGVIWIIGALLTIIYIQNNKIKEARHTVNALTSELKTYKLKNGNLVYSNEIATLHNRTLKQNIIDKDNELKEMADKFAKVTQVQKIKAKISLPKTKIKHDTVFVYKDLDSLKITLKGAYYNEWYEFGYTATQDSLTINPFHTWTEIKRVDGFKRKWFLGRKTYYSDITFTNPYINVEEVQTYKVAIPVKWYDTRAFNVAVGLTAGLLLK